MAQDKPPFTVTVFRENNSVSTPHFTAKAARHYAKRMAGPSVVKIEVSENGVVTELYNKLDD